MSKEEYATIYEKGQILRIDIPLLEDSTQTEKIRVIGKLEETPDLWKITHFRGTTYIPKDTKQYTLIKI